MGDASSAEKEPGNRAAKTKRPRDAILLAESRDCKTHSKRPCSPESLSSRVIAWLSQLPPENTSEADLDMARPLKGNGKKNKSNGDGSVTGGLATTSIASTAGVSRPVTATSIIKTEATTSTRRLIEQPDYRSKNLKENYVHVSTRLLPLPIPTNVTDKCDDMGKSRASPEPTPEETPLETEDLYELQDYGGAGSRVKDCFKGDFFPLKKVVARDGLRPVSRPTFIHCIPNAPTRNRISRPVPDLVYGYNATDPRSAFSDKQKIAGTMMDPELGVVDSGNNLAFPFLVIEFNGDWTGSGSLWVATNQCLGASATCTEAVSRLNDQLRKYPGARLVADMTFSIAMSQNEARIYVTWKTKELQYHVQKAAVFYIVRPEEYQLFRRYVKNILDWGKGQRLQDIKKALDTILEEDREVNSAQAKQRPAPSLNSGSASVKRSHVAQASSSSVAPGSSSSRTQSPAVDFNFIPGIRR